MEPIALIGQAFRLPDGVEDASSFWDMLEHGRNMMREWPENRANLATFYKPGSGVKNTVGRTRKGFPAESSVAAHKAASSTQGEATS